MHTNYSHTKFQLRFSKSLFLTVRTVKRVERHHYAKFRRNRSNHGRDTCERYIMLVWLENAYSRLFLAFFGAHFPQMISLVLTPKWTILGLNHVI